MDNTDVNSPMIEPTFLERFLDEDGEEYMDLIRPIPRNILELKSPYEVFFIFFPITALFIGYSLITINILKNKKKHDFTLRMQFDVE
jgi:hypothetical protein